MSSCNTDSQVSYCHVLTDEAPLAIAHMAATGRGELFVHKYG